LQETKIKILKIGDWGLGIVDGGLVIGPNPQSPIPNPQSPIPNNSIKHNIHYNIFNYFRKINLKSIIK